MFPHTITAALAMYAPSGVPPRSGPEMGPAIIPPSATSICFPEIHLKSFQLEWSVQVEWQARHLPLLIDMLPPEMEQWPLRWL
jgi:hypothetical protein